ncbi:MAG: hypothetical protein LBR20_08875 [Propionibacteriaceae bacterium]|jgi:hypothetical protein|nr:hypothetical protein [Propionibacteriaceae bacterium]
MSKRKDAVEEAPKKKGGFRKFLKLVSLLSLIGGGLYALSKRFKSDPDAGWVQLTPPDAYIADPVADVTEDIVKAAEK